MKIFTYTTLAVLILVCGVIHGGMTDRWSASSEVAAAAERLERFPVELPGWKGTVQKINEGKQYGLAGSVTAKFVHEETGKEVMVFFACGKPGPVSIHTPDVCYSASGFKEENRKTVAVPTPGEEAKFFTSKFHRTRDSDKADLRIYWSWNHEKDWTVSDQPRLQFTQSKVLYKLYVIRDLHNTDEAAQADVCLDLIAKLTPALDARVIQGN